MNNNNYIVEYVKSTKQGYISFDNITLYFDNSDNKIKFKKLYSNKLDKEKYNDDILNNEKNNICMDINISSESIVSSKYKNLITVNKASQSFFNSIYSDDFTLDEEFEKSLILKIENKLS